MPCQSSHGLPEPGRGCPHHSKAHRKCCSRCLTLSLLSSHLLVILGGDLALSRAKASGLTSSLDPCPRNASSLHACPCHVRNLWARERG